MAFMAELGHTGSKLMIKSDQESRVRVVAAKIATGRLDGGTLLENSLVKSSGSNGVIERGVQEFEYQLRTMKSALDHRLGIKVAADSNVLPWMIEFSSVLLNRYLVGKDGLTEHERMKGKRSKMCGFEFAGAVHFRSLSPQGRLVKLDSLWDTGDCLRMSIKFCGVQGCKQRGCIKKTRNLRRKPIEERREQEAVEGLKFTP